MPELKLLWKHPVAGECDAGIAAVGSTVVAADHDEGHDYYRCLDAAGGTETWARRFPNGREMDYGAGPRATPLVEQDKVYVLSAFGELYCFDLKTGKTVWQLDFHKDFGVAKEPKWGCSSSPLIAGGKLIVNPGGTAALAALDPETGKVLWKGKGGGPNYASFITGAFGGVEQVVGHDDAGLGGWDLGTGRRLWSIGLEQGDGYIVPTPVRLGDKVVITDTHNESQLFAFGRGGAIVAKPAAKSEDIAPEVITPVAAGDLVLGLSHALVCLDANDLSTLWSYKREPILNRDCHLIVAQDRGLAFSGRGELVLFSFDRQGVKILGKKKLCGQTRMHPTVAAGRLYVRDGQFLYCYDLGTNST
jgi:outer membrane protein assembly factor BamB